MEKPSLDKLKNKGTVATAATIAAAGVLIGGAFEAPADILKNDEMAPAPAPIVEVLDAQAEPDDGDGGDETVAEEEEEKKKGGVRAKTRELILRMPLAVRACVAVPLWCVGWAIISLASLLWAGVISPVGSEILKWVLIALMILSAVALTVKTVFPKTPLKKILNRRTLLWVLGGSTLFCIANVVLQKLYPDAPRLYDIARVVASAALLVSALIPVLKHEQKERQKCAEEEQAAREAEEAAALEAEIETPEQAQARVEREILELADSVSFR